MGAGPAGLTTAAGLAAGGFSVLVLEEHPIIGLPVHCTGVLGLQAFDEFDLPRDTICTETRAARFHGRHGRSIRIDGGHVSAAVVDRGLFDQALARRAADAGAVLACGVRVTDVAIAEDAVRLEATRDGAPHRLRGRACVLACGAQYRFNRRLGLGIPRAYLQSAQLETPFPPVRDVEIDLDRTMVPRGFAWMVPFERGGVSMARVGLMASDGAAARFATYARRLVDRHDVAGSSLAQPRLKVLPLAPVKRTYADRVLAVGDAAGLAKPTTGGGIYYSLLSGRYAAEVLGRALRDDRTDAATLRQYEQMWQARIGPDLRAGLAFRTLVARFDDRAIDALLELAAVDGIVPLLRRTADFNWHRAAALALLRNPGFRKIVLSSLWT